MTSTPAPAAAPRPPNAPLARSPGRRHKRLPWMRVTVPRHVSRAAGNDRAVSDVLSSMLMIGVTVALVGTAALGFASNTGEGADSSVPRIDLTALGRGDEMSITLQHVGGSAIQGDAIRALVYVDGAVWYQAPVPASQWDVGDIVQLQLAQPLPAGAHVAVSLVHIVRGETLATSEFDVPAAARAPVAATSLGFTIGLTLAGGQTTALLEPPAELLVEAHIEHPQGRKFVRFAYVNLIALQGPAYAELRDDGASGDRHAGDGIYTATALIPRNVTAGLKVVTATAVDLNGTRLTANATIDVLKRSEVTEESLNPTGTPVAAAIPLCPTGKAAVASYRYIINGEREVRDLTGNVRAGDHVVVYAKAAPGCTATTLSLVSYTAPTAVFTWQNATQMVIHDMQTVAVGSTREHALEVTVPSCYFQVSFVTGAPLLTMGPAGTNNYYSTQGRLIDADNGGNRAC